MIRSLIARALALGSLLGQQADFVNFEPPAVHPVRLSPSGLRLFTVDPENHHLDVWSLADPSHPILATRIQVGLGPVSVTPRTDDEVSVVCWLSDSVSVVLISEGREVATLRVKDEPSGIVPGVTLGNIQAYNPTQLRNLYRRAGFSFDGTTPGLTAFLNLSFFASYPSALKDDLVVFMTAFDTGACPIVGYRLTVDATTAGLSTTAADLSTMIARAAALDADLIASTRVNGVPVDWLFSVVLGQWLPDRAAMSALSNAASLAQASSGTLLGIVTGVAWGTGHRMALDSNRDSILDGDAMPDSYSAGTLGVNGIPTLTANGEASVGNASTDRANRFRSGRLGRPFGRAWGVGEPGAARRSYSLGQRLRVTGAPE